MFIRLSTGETWIHFDTTILFYSVMDVANPGRCSDANERDTTPDAANREDKSGDSLSFASEPIEDNKNRNNNNNNTNNNRTPSGQSNSYPRPLEIQIHPYRS